MPDYPPDYVGWLLIGAAALALIGCALAAAMLLRIEQRPTIDEAADRRPRDPTWPRGRERRLPRGRDPLADPSRATVD